jgi:predicted O-methyltransferase YrrM
MIQTALRSVPGARPLLGRARAAWERARPLPRPRYRPGTPRIGGDDPWDPFLPPGAETLGAAATAPEAVDAVLAVVEKLTPSPEITSQQVYYAWSRQQYGRCWRHADLTTALWAAATLIRPNSYLEIGPRRGRSAAVVASVRPQCAFYGFDLWVPDYAGLENPGPDFVRDELRAVGHTGLVTLVSGDSSQTVPAFLRAHADLHFDLITIDGSKAVPVVAADFANTLPRLKVGGAVLYDDLPFFPELRRVWDAMVGRDGRFVCWEFAGARTGVAVAVRVGDE